ncbi:MAG: hypothetical protein ACLQGP_02635 [Isosphaeraceae bacterium]
MRLPRMTTRRWMVVVLIASVLLGVLVMLRRAAHFMRLALLHEHMAHLLRSTTGPSADPKGADHNERLARKYQRAAARPWLAIEPDSE